VSEQNKNMSAPNFSPIASYHKKLGGNSSSRKAASSISSASDASKRSKYQCPGCKELFTKWSPCLSHLREKKHLDANMLDKRLNGGDFRRVQELCATLAFHHLGGGGNGGRERADSNYSTDSFSSDSGGEEDEVGANPGKKVQSRSKFSPVNSSRPSAELPGARFVKMTRKAKVSLRSLDEKIIFRILSFLDVDSARWLFLAMTETPERTMSPIQSRVRLWSLSSDIDSAPNSPQISVSRRSFVPDRIYEQL
jgi:hypothetical protein